MNSMGGGKRQELVIKRPSDMALGCFIGVMILLVIVILFLAFSGNRLNSMLNNQNNTTHALNIAIDLAILAKARDKYKYKPKTGDPIGPDGLNPDSSAGENYPGYQPDFPDDPNNPNHPVRPSGKNNFGN